MKKIVISLISLLAGATVALTPAAAQASSPMWYHGREPVISEFLHVTGSGTIQLHRGATYSMRCKASIHNGTLQQQGYSQLDPLAITACTMPKPTYPCPRQSKVEVLTRSPNGSWDGYLDAGAPIRDEIERIEIEIHCAGTEFGEDFTGTLTPAVTNSGALKFDAGSGELESEASPGSHLSFTGSFKLTAATGSHSVKAK